VRREAAHHATEPETPLPKQGLQERVATAILSAAARLFATRGDEASMAEVAERAGVARATVYRYFPNRQQLLDELARTAADDARRRWTTARIHELPAEEGITRAVRVLVELGDAFVVLARRGGEGSRDDFERALGGSLLQLLERGRASGLIRDDLPIAWLADCLVGVVVDVLRQGSGPDDAVARATSLFLDGARTRPPRVS
jgi:TetR/AcrR family transcriptional repressor of mexCD-oprJ operon